MTHPVVIASQAADRRERGWTNAGATALSIPHRTTRNCVRFTAAAAVFNSHRERFCAILAQRNVVPVIMRTVGAHTANSRVHHNTKSVRSFSGDPRVQPRKQSFRGRLQAFQVVRSLPNAPELHGHLSKGVDAACAKKPSHRSMS